MIRGVVASGKRRGGVPVQIILTSGTSWTVPADWNNAANRIECIGAGNYGGGAYARKNNLALTPGASVTYRVGVASTTQGITDTWFYSLAIVKAVGSIGTTGGAAASCVGDVVYSGGSTSGPPSTRGGGGAAGPNGDGLANSGSTGGAGDAGFGGAGGLSGQPGGNGTEWGTAGSGGGSGSGSGAAGGLYGGGSGTSGVSNAAPGVIVITYTPA